MQSANPILKSVLEPPTTILLSGWEKKWQYHFHKVMIDLHYENKLNLIDNTCMTCFNKTCFLSTQIFETTFGFHWCFAKKNIFFIFSLDLLNICMKFSVMYTFSHGLVDRYPLDKLLLINLQERHFDLSNYILGCVRRLSCHGIYW